MSKESKISYVNRLVSA